MVETVKRQENFAFLIRTEHLYEEKYVNICSNKVIPSAYYFIFIGAATGTGNDQIKKMV